MASIQGAMNQLLGAAAGVATAGTYMYKQTPGYQAEQEAKLAERKVAQINKVINTKGETPLSEMPQEELGHVSAIADKAIQFREQALEASPNEARTEALRKAYATRQEIDKVLAEETARRTIEQDKVWAAYVRQTEAYQKALMEGKNNGNT